MSDRIDQDLGTHVEITPQGAAYVEWLSGFSFERTTTAAFAAGWHARDDEVERLRALGPNAVRSGEGLASTATLYEAETERLRAVFEAVTPLYRWWHEHVIRAASADPEEVA